MSNRPYFQKSINELEALFSEQSSNAAVLADLERELVHRTTQRAKTLKDKVSKTSKSPPKQNQNGTMACPRSAHANDYGASIGRVSRTRS